MTYLFDSKELKNAVILCYMYIHVSTIKTSTVKCPNILRKEIFELIGTEKRNKTEHYCMTTCFKDRLY